MREKRGNDGGERCKQDDCHDGVAERMVFEACRLEASDLAPFAVVGQLAMQVVKKSTHANVSLRVSASFGRAVAEPKGV